jgi:hypothetical protein
MSTATSIKETLWRKMNALPVGYYPKVLHFIETLEEADDDYDEEEYAEWLANNPPIPIEEDPTISPEHLERLRQRFKDMDEGKTKVIPFSEEEWEEFWQEVEHSPQEALAKAYNRRCYLTPKQS